MYQKFIITLDGTLLFGNVFLHRELLPYGDSTCYGGGLWKIDDQRKCIILFGRSFDFGLPDFAYLQRVNYSETGYREYPIFYQRHFATEEVLECVWPK